MQCWNYDRAFLLDKSVRSDLGLLAWGEKNRLSTMMVAAQQQNTISMMICEENVRLDTMSSFDDRVDMSTFTLQDLNKICERADNTWRIIKDEPLMKSFLK